MKKEDIRICILRVGGTNCDSETQRAFQELGVQAETLHLNELLSRQNLMEYHILVFPGGFSFGDYVRAGVIWARWLSAKMGKQLETFVEGGRLVLGVCNGFQVLVEYGLLPAFDGVSSVPEATLATNVPQGYDCRWVYLRHENRGNCVFTHKIPKGVVLRVPIAHSEGRFLFPKEKEQKLLERLYKDDLLVFRYCNSDGDYANGQFPTNPNGSFHDIAGVCNRDGTVFGLMPHPERAMCWWQQPDWTQHSEKKPGDGKLVFESMLEHLVKTF
jgi:phosphoribosylformylglycinamidine synthase